jgi:hypothetical protein
MEESFETIHWTTCAIEGEGRWLLQKKDELAPSL